MKTKQAFILQILAIAALVISCNSPNGPMNNSLTLSAEVSCTEAWLKLSANNVSLPKGVTLTRDGNSIFNFTLTTRDTTLYDSTLVPNKSYTYQALLSPLGGQSNKVVATTLDTTSHNFSWQMFTFGEQSSSVLYDVAIINENDIWAVGEIYTKDSYTYDSLGNWIDPYNAIHWDGEKWGLKRIYYNYNGSYLWSPIRTIFAFNENDIWFGTNLHWNGKTYEQPFSSVLTGWSVNKLFGTSSNDLYAVGNSGNIAHYNGTYWQKIESGTSVDIQDIWGTDNEGRQTILCSASNVASGGEHKILKINGTKVEQVEWVNSRRTHSIWFDDSNSIFSCGGGVYIKKHRNWIEQTSLPLTYTRRVRGNAKNDVFVVGDFGLVEHYNGTNWKTYPEAAQGIFYSMDYKKGIMVATGGSDNAILLVMKKLK
ncbi:MAG: glucosyl transferase [Bacteroidetes bacterium]|nr:glucosyl transferase [Bacteroidota bacterium]